MEIKTKLSVGNDAYFIFNNKIVFEPVNNITLSVDDKGYTVIYYGFEFGNPDNLTKHKVHERSVYATSSEILDKLKGTICSGYDSFF